MAAKEVKLPDIGEGVTEGELVKWLVKVGDTVKSDQPVAEVMTDKATVEVPTPFAGTVKELKAKEGDIIPIETILLILEAGASSAPSPAAASSAAKAPVESTVSKAPTSSQQPMAVSKPATGRAAPQGMEVFPPPADSRVLATPSTRRLAREMSLDINQMSGSGIAGRVTREDVLKGKDAGAGAVSGGMPKVQFQMKALERAPGQLEERVALRGVRRKIAEKMQMAKHVVPHFTLMEEANVSELVKLRELGKAKAEAQGVKLTYLPFVMKALVATMRDFPMFNASIDDVAQEIVYKKFFNLGFAADTPNGLLVPVIKAADQKTLLHLGYEISDLAKKARDGKLSLEEMSGATISVTNIGSVGGTYATPIINHPEVAILGMYKIWDKPIWTGTQFVPQKTMNFTITCDHRLIDGAVAANFMKAFISRIENPSHLMMDMI